MMLIGNTCQGREAGERRSPMRLAKARSTQHIHAETVRGIRALAACEKAVQDRIAGGRAGARGGACLEAPVEVALIEAYVVQPEGGLAAMLGLEARRELLQRLVLLLPVLLPATNANAMQANAMQRPQADTWAGTAGEAVCGMRDEAGTGHWAKRGPMGLELAMSAR